MKDCLQGTKILYSQCLYAVGYFVFMLFSWPETRKGNLQIKYGYALQCFGIKIEMKWYIQRTIWIYLVLGPSTTSYRSFFKRCTLIQKAVGTIWRDLSKPSQRRQGGWGWSSSPLIVVRDFLSPGPELGPRWAKHSLLWRMSLDIFST